MLKEYFTKKRFLSIITLIVFLFNMFAPTVTFAAEPAAGEPYYKLKIHAIDDTIDEEDWTEDTWAYYYDYYQGDVESKEESEVHAVYIDVLLDGCSTITAGDIFLRYDSSKLIASQESYSGTGKKKVYFLEDATSVSNPNTKSNQNFANTDGGWESVAFSILDANNSTIRLTGGMLGANRLEPGKTVATYLFRLADGVSLSDLSKDCFSLVPATGLADGLEITYRPDGTQHVVDGATYLKFEGFSSSTQRHVSQLLLEGTMNKSRYYNGEVLDFSGLTLKVKYDDESQETISDIAGAITAGTITIDTNIASSAKKSVITLDSITCDINYEIATAISVKDTPTKTVYDHGDTINFSGGTIDVSYSDGYKANINMTTGISNGTFTIDRTKANISNTYVTFKYIDNTLTATLPLTVKDPINKIEITNMPTKLTYNHGEQIDVTGGVIKATRKSGATITGISMSDPKVTMSSTNADIAKCTSTWQVGDLDAGNQNITVTYTDDNVAKSTTYTVVVNDTVASIAKKNDPSAKNKYKTAAGSLNVNGATITVTTAAGKTFDVNVSLGMVDTSGYNSETFNTQNLPVTYNSITTANGEGIDVKLYNYINGIEVTAPAGLEADYNTNINLSNVKYKKLYADGSKSDDLAVTQGMISNYNKTPSAGSFNNSHKYTQTVTVTLSTADDNSVDEIPQTDTFQVTTVDTVSGIVILTLPSKTVYNYGETFSENGGKIGLQYASGVSGYEYPMNISGVTITENDGTPINMSPAASSFVNGICTKTLKVTYTHGEDTYSATFNIKIKEVLDSVKIDTQPTKIFEHGDSFSVGNGTLELTYKSGNKKTIALDAGTIIEETSSGSIVNMSPSQTLFTNHLLTKNLTVSYTEGGVTRTVNYDITITDPIDHIEINKSPKKKYNLNETTTQVGGSINLIRNSGDTEEVNIDDTWVSNLNTLTTGTRTATIIYPNDGNPKNITYQYTVEDAILGISVTGPSKVKYNQDLDLSQITLNVEKCSGTIQETVTPAMVTDFNKTTLGNQTVKVTYAGIDATFNTTVQDYVTGITVSPATVTGTYGDTLESLISAKNIKYTVTYASAGAKTPEALVDTMVSTFNNESVDAQNLIVTYEDTDENSYTKGTEFTTQLTITLADALESITVTAPTSTQNYIHGGTPNLTGATITKNYVSGAHVSVTPTQAMLFEEGTDNAVSMSPASYDGTNKVTKTITLKYKDGTVEGSADYQITIVNDVKSIAIHGTPKTKYNVNDNMDANLEIEVTRAVGTPEVKSVTSAMIPEFSTASAGNNKTATISYTENEITKTVEYQYDVVDTISSIAINNAPTKAKYGEDLNLTGTTITVTKGSGEDPTPVQVTKNMLSGYNKQEVGEQEVTVTYGVDLNGNPVTAKFNVTVQDYVTGITVSPATVTGTYGDTLESLISAKNIKYTVTYASAGAKTPEALVDTMVSEFNNETALTQNLTVTYEDTDENSYTKGTEFTTQLTITLADVLESITVTAPTSTQNYNHAGTPDLTGATITKNYVSGAHVSVTPTQAMLFEEGTDNVVNMSPASYDGTNKVTKTITLKYKDGTVEGSADYQITIVNDVKSIAIHGTPKTKYNVNDNMDANLEIEVTRAVGTPEVKSVTSAMIPEFSTASAGNNKTATISYTENEITKTVIYTYDVVDTVSSIAINNAPTKAKYGEDLNLTGTTITVTKGSGEDPTPVQVTSNMISGYDKDVVGEQEVTVSYGEDLAGNPVTTTFNVKVQDYVQEIQINPASVTGVFGDTLENIINTNNIKYTVVYASAGAKTPEALVDTMVSEFNNETALTQNLTVTYEDTDENSYTKGNNITGILAITLKDEVNSITVSGQPTTLKYGEDLDTSTLVVKAIKDSAPLGVVIPIEEVTITGYDKTKLGVQEVKISYGNKEVTFNVTVEDYVVGIVLTAPSKDTYLYNEDLDLTGGSILVQTASGTGSYTLELDSTMISGYNKTKLGAQTVYVTYEEQTATFGVNVEDTILSISMNNTPKTEYNYGENLEVTGGTISVTRASGTTTEELQASMVEGYDPEKIGEQTLTVTYGNTTTSYNVTVTDNIDRITIVAPDKLVYNLNESLDLTGGQVNVITASGQVKETVNMDASMISGFTTSSVGAKTITVSYSEKTTTFGIVVKDPVASINIEDLPNKLEYLVAESLDLTGGTIRLTRDSGDSEIISMTDSSVSVTGFSSSTDGTKLLTVSITLTEDEVERAEVVGTFQVTVTDYEVGTSVVAPTKISYEYGENLDLTNGKIKIMLKSGAVKEEADLTGSMVSGYDPFKEGNQEITVTYKGYTNKFNVTVKDSVGGISINTEPTKTTYEYGEPLDVTGGKIKVVRTSGTSIIDIANYMISGYNPNLVGYQKVVVTYEGFSTEYIVYVYPEAEDDKETAPTVKDESSDKKQNGKKPTIRVNPSYNAPIDNKEEQPVEEIIPETKPVEVKTEDKPTITLGEKDTTEKTGEKTDNKYELKAIVLIASIILLILLISKKNTKIFVEEEGKAVLGGKEKLSKNNTEINVNKYLDGETYKKPVRIVLNDSISEKLNGKELAIRHRDKTIKVKVEYKDAPFEINLK